jgi:hypothetical protein
MDSHIKSDNGTYMAKIINDDISAPAPLVPIDKIASQNVSLVVMIQACTILLQALSKWLQEVTDNMWPFTLDYMVNFHNALVLHSNQASPFSLFTSEDPPICIAAAK